MDRLVKQMQAWFGNSLRMPLMVHSDRENLLDWVDYEALYLLEANQAPDIEAAQRQAVDRLLESPRLLRALVPELSLFARPGPRGKMALAALSQVLGWGCFALLLKEIAPLLSGLGFVAGAMACRLLLCGAAEKIMRLRGHYREGWAAAVGMLGCPGYLAYHLAVYLPQRRKQLAAMAAAEKEKKISE